MQKAELGVGIYCILYQLCIQGGKLLAEVDV